MSTEIVLKESTTTLAKAIKKDLTLSKDGIIEVTPDIYEKHLEATGLTMADVKRLQQHNSDFVASLGLAVGEIGLDAMKRKKDLDMVYAEVKIGRDTLVSQFDRSKQVPDGSGGVATQFGKLTSKYTVAGASNKGELKKVRQHLMHLAEATLK